jgi:tetratricopeptide (TPR) repeat protein
MLVACQSLSGKDTIAELRHKQIELKEEKIEGGLEKAMLSYQRFLEETPDSNLAPEAIRRLADLKIEKEYGTLTEGVEPAGRTPASKLPSSEGTTRPGGVSVSGAPMDQPLAHIAAHDEPEADFERRATQNQQLTGMAVATGRSGEGANDLERVGAREAIELYTKLLNDYPHYERNDQVLYQMSRAYEELGKTDEAMEVMDRMVREYPRSRYIDEVQFRRAEYFFVRRRYLDAEDAYKSVVDMGVSSSFYELALYKLGWTFYKQEIYADALDRFIALLDHKVSMGYDFEQTEDEQERKRTDDTFRVVSLSFSYLGGADAVVEYFSRHGKRSYEDLVYSNLGEFYFEKRRYADASATYNGFVSRNPFHKVAPNFNMRVIEIQAAGGFPTLVLDFKKKFATTYGLKAEYWEHFDPADRPEVLGYLKTNLTDLANHYHACYQDPRQAEEKQANFEEALQWYRAFLKSFPTEIESPAINYLLAELLLENQSFGAAAVEFEKTAYGYPSHEKSSHAGFAAVSAHRQQLSAAAPEDKDTVRREHEKAAIVLGAAADDLYGMKEYEQALAAANKLLEVFPSRDVDAVRAAWLVIAHSSYELLRYSEAETAYLKVLELLPEGDEASDELVDNLAASIYKQGEQANAIQDYRVAADHFLRVGRMAPTSKIRPTAEYDAAASLIELKDWEMAAAVLVGFRNSFPGHGLQSEVTKKIAYVYKENGQLSLAANEYERIERESQDDEIRRDALLVAAELHEKNGNSVRALEVYQRYVGYFPQPVELNLETRSKIAEILQAQNDRESYLNELGEIVSIDASAGSDRTPRTRYLAAQLMDYELGEFTAAATFYMAEIYAHFSKALMTSERPELTFDYYIIKPGDNLSTIARRNHSDIGRIAHANNLKKSNVIVAGRKLKIPRGLYPEELEQYELALEEQAYPFEEKAISVHESNLKLISRGVYNKWIDKSLQKLAVLMPARYDKPEASSGIVSSLETYTFEIDRPTRPLPSKVSGGEPARVEEAGSVTEVTTQVEEAGSVTEVTPEESTQVEEAGSVTEVTPEEPTQVEEAGSVTEVKPEEPARVEEPVQAKEPVQNEQPTGTWEQTQMQKQAPVPAQGSHRAPLLARSDRPTRR